MGSVGYTRNKFVPAATLVIEIRVHSTIDGEELYLLRYNTRYKDSREEQQCERRSIITISVLSVFGISSSSSSQCERSAALSRVRMYGRFLSLSLVLSAKL